MESSPPELSDPSAIGEIVFCGMNFFNTRYYCNGYSHCQTGAREKSQVFYNLSAKRNNLRFGSVPKEPHTAGTAPASGQERDPPRRRESPCRGERQNFELPGPSRRLRPSLHADYEGFHARKGNLWPEKMRALGNDTLIIRTPRRQNQRGKNHNLDSDRDARVTAPKPAIGNSKWARLDSNQGPRDYESPALPLSYRPVNLGN